MKIRIRQILTIVGLFALFSFCLGAATGMAEGNPVLIKSVPEPVIMVVFGIGLIWLGSFIKKADS